MPNGFTHDQIWGGLVPEFGSTKFVLATGLRLLREASPFERDKDAILATLAAGVEKLEKLALGIMAVEAGGEWPDMSDGRRGWGHRTAQMDRRL